MNVLSCWDIMKRCDVVVAVPQISLLLVHKLTQLVILFLPSSKQPCSQTDSARDLKLWDNVHHPLLVVGVRSVIFGATPSSFNNMGHNDLIPRLNWSVQTSFLTWVSLQGEEDEHPQQEVSHPGYQSGGSLVLKVEKTPITQIATFFHSPPPHVTNTTKV